MAITLTGCGSEKAGNKTSPASSAGTGAVGTGPTTAAPARETTKLTVAFRPSTRLPIETWTLTCDPVGGDHPNAKAACAALDKAAAAGKDPFALTPTGRACSMIYGGPEVSTVTGTWRGKKIDTRFSRKDGCEVARWASLAPLLGEVARPR